MMRQMMTAIRKEPFMIATYYIGADVHSNSTELAIEKNNRNVARYMVPTTIPSISNVLDSLQGKKRLAFQQPYTQPA